MKKTLCAAAAAAFVAVGCNQSEPGGKPVPATASHTSNYPEATGSTDSSKTFTLSAPVLSTSIKQGERQIVKLSVDRGSEFRQSVRLDAEAPKGLKAEFGKQTITAADPEEVSLTVTADRDAAVGDHRIKVTGAPDAGNATSVEVKITVDEAPKQ